MLISLVTEISLGIGGESETTMTKHTGPDKTQENRESDFIVRIPAGSTASYSKARAAHKG